MNPDVREKITKGVKTTELWVTLLAGVLVTLMLFLQEQSATLLPVDLSMKILGFLGVAYVVCRTVLKVAALVVQVLQLDRGAPPPPIPEPPEGVPVPEATINLTTTVQDHRMIPWTRLRAQELAADDTPPVNAFDGKPRVATKRGRAAKKS